MNQDKEHVDLLGIFHYVVAGIAALFSCFPLMHLFMGIMVMTVGFDESQNHSGPAPWIFGLFFVVFASVAILMGLAFAICIAFAGKYLRKRVKYMFCLVMAGIECMFMPFGTVLGVFTIIVLQRPGVKLLFGRPVEDTSGKE
jgi:hypothetical protein